MVPMLQGPWRPHTGGLPRSPHTPNRRQQPAGLKGRGSARGTSTVHLASLEAPTTQPRCCERCARPQGVGLRRCTQEEGVKGTVEPPRPPRWLLLPQKTSQKSPPHTPTPIRG